MASQTTTYSPVSTASLLLVAFVVLKLTHVIAWSWWWVLAPAWIPFAILIVILIVALFFFSLKAAL